MSKPKILILSTQDFGGAGTASIIINDLINKCGYESKLVVKKSQTNKKNVIGINTLSSRKLLIVLFNKFRNRIFKYKNKRILKSLDSKYSFYNIDEKIRYTKTRTILKSIDFKPEIIILHWITGFVNSKTINELYKITKAKIIWHIMDNAPFTGGCHYPWQCKEYQDECSNCPAILQSNLKIRAKNNLSQKREYIPHNIELITCSQSDFNRVKSATLFKHTKTHKILLPVDENIFIPFNKIIARKYLGVPLTKKKIIFFAALSIIDERKGFVFFIDALNKIKKDMGLDYLNNIHLIIAGTQTNTIKRMLPCTHTFLGYVPYNILPKCYQSADLFVSTSIEDSGPYMINQSIMSGCPVVAFEMGVALDLVITGETGYRVKLMNSEDLAKGIMYLIEMPKKNYIKMSQNCRELGLDLCHSTKQVNKIIDVLSKKV